MNLSWNIVTTSLALTIMAVSSEQVPVHWELVMERGFPPGQERQWLELLQKFPDVSIRIRTADPGERPQITPRGRGWQVVGVLTRANRLQVPGGNFSLADRAAITAWLSRLRSDGPDAVTGNVGPFGLTERQWTELFDKLRRPVGRPTANMTQAELIAHVSRQTEVPVQVDPSLQREMASFRVTDELATLSCGTALAVALRPNGLVVTVERQMGKPSLRVVSARDGTPYWPVGYEPAEAIPNTLPSLLKYLPVEIRDTPLSEVLETVAGRLGAPILVDHNGLAREGIQPGEIRVNIPAGRTSYKRILEQCLFQAKLRFQLRVDEAGTPFLWVTPIRQP